MDALLPERAIVDKMIGDEVMAFFIPAFQKDAAAAAMRGASKILKAVGNGSSARRLEEEGRVFPVQSIVACCLCSLAAKGPHLIAEVLLHQGNFGLHS